MARSRSTLLERRRSSIPETNRWPVRAGNKPVFRDYYSHVCGAKCASLSSVSTRSSCRFPAEDAETVGGKRGLHRIKPLSRPIGRSYGQGVSLRRLSHCDKYRMTHAVQAGSRGTVIVRFYWAWNYCGINAKMAPSPQARPAEGGRSLVAPS